MRQILWFQGTLLFKALCYRKAGCGIGQGLESERRRSQPSGSWAEVREEGEGFFREVFGGEMMTWLWSGYGYGVGRVILAGEGVEGDGKVEDG